MTDAQTKVTRTLVGKVVSDARAKTVTVLVERRAKHELYGKIVAKSRKYQLTTRTMSSRSVTWSKSAKAALCPRPRAGCDPSGPEGRAGLIFVI